jgi:hypothetical protein
MTVAMQLGTLVALPQLGAPGAAGSAKLGFVPKVLFGPYENPALSVAASLVPLAEYPQES